MERYLWRGDSQGYEYHREGLTAMTNPKLLTCLRCGHTWTPRINRPPASCPACHSYRWDKPRKED